MISIIRTREKPYTLENTIREAMLQRDHHKALVVLEGLYHLKYEADTWLTFKQIRKLLEDNFGTAFRLTYEGLQQKLVFQRRKAQPQAGQRGRPSYLYRIPSPLELKAEFAPDSQSPTDTLTKDDLKSVHTYKLALHREKGIRLFIKNGGRGYQMYRDLQADSLNLSTRTIRTYDKLLNWSAEANYKETRISRKDWQKLPRYKSAYSPTGQKLPSRQWLKAVDWETGSVEIMPCVAYLAYAKLSENKAVYTVEREANTYYPYNRPNKANLGDIDSVDYYYLDMEARAEAGFYRDSDGLWYHQRE